MNPKAWLFLLYLSIVSDSIACAISAYKCRKMWKRNPDNQLVRVLYFLTFCAFMSTMIMLMANTFQHKIEASTGYTILYWVGRAALSLGFWKFTLFLQNGKSQ